MESNSDTLPDQPVSARAPGGPSGERLWRRQSLRRHIAVPMLSAALGVGISLAMGGQDKALLHALPPLAVLAAFALPTLKRGFTSAIENGLVVEMLTPSGTSTVTSLPSRALMVIAVPLTAEMTPRTFMVGAGAGCCA